MSKKAKVLTKELVTRKAKYRVRNSEGQYEVVYLETSADQVQETADRVFVTPDEKGKIGEIDTIKGQIGVINGAESQEGSIAKALKDAKSYTDGQFGQVDTKIDNKVNAAKGEINGTISALTGRVQTNEGAIAELKSTIAQKGSRTVVVDTEEEIATANTAPQIGDMAFVISSKRAYIYKGVDALVKEAPAGWIVFDEITSEVDLVNYLKKSDAEGTYLKKTDAESTYLKSATAGSTYLKSETAESTYFKKTDKVQESGLHDDLKNKINGKLDASAVDGKIDAKLNPAKEELNGKIDKLVPTLCGSQPEGKLEGHVWLEIVGE